MGKRDSLALTQICILIKMSGLTKKPEIYGARQTLYSKNVDSIWNILEDLLNLLDFSQRVLKLGVDVNGEVDRVSGTVFLVAFKILLIAIRQYQ